MNYTMQILLAALALVESGGSDIARGKSGEVSRYQIMPYIWGAETKSTQWKDPEIARIVAERILSKRIDHFVKKTGRLPDASQVYALWNKPGAFENAGFNLHKLGVRTQQRCSRYANAVNKMLSEKESQLALDKRRVMSQ